MAGIKAGDNGTVLELPIKDNGAVVPLNGATVSVIIRTDDRRIVKDAVIKDATNGLCEVTLTATDVATAGTYALQGIVKRQDGGEFASDVEKFTVGARI